MVVGREEGANLRQEWQSMERSLNNTHKAERYCFQMLLQCRVIQKFLSAKNWQASYVDFLFCTTFILCPTEIASTPTTTCSAVYSSLLCTEADHRLSRCGHIQAWRHALGRRDHWISLQSSDFAGPLMIYLGSLCSSRGVIMCTEAECIHINMPLAASENRCYLISLWKTTVNAWLCLRSLLIITQNS